MSAPNRGIADVVAGIGRRIVSSARRPVLFYPVDTRLWRSETFREKLEYTPVGFHHAFWKGLREHVRRTEMPAELRRTSHRSGTW